MAYRSAGSTTTRFFDRWSATYDIPGFQRATYRPVHDAVLGRLRRLDPAVVVDLGWGTGQLTRRHARAYADATNVRDDFSPGMHGEAVARLASVDPPVAPPVIQADEHHLTYASATVEVVVCTESFHWYQDQGGALDDLASVLRPDGRLLIASIATYTTVGDRALRAATRRGGNPVRALPPARLRTLLDRAGFDVLHQRRVPRPGLPWPVLTDARRR